MNRLLNNFYQTRGNTPQNTSVSIAYNGRFDNITLKKKKKKKYLIFN